MRRGEAGMNKAADNMTLDELKTELKRLKGELCDLEDVHAFTFGKTSVHIGAEQAQNMAVEYEEERKRLMDRIAALELALTKQEGRMK